MADLHHEIHVAARPEAVIDAITTQDGLRAWWTSDSVAEPRVGAVAEFGFGERSTVFRMKVTALSAERVEWACVGDVDEWEGTTLRWQVQPDDDGCLLRFTHAGWRSEDGMFATCNTTWGELMYRLRDHVEGRQPGPLFCDSE